MNARLGASTAADVSVTLTPRGCRTSRDVRANPTNAKGRYVETREYIQAARRFIRGAGRRVADMDLAEVADLAALVDEGTAVLDAAVLRLHDDCGYSWGEIGKAFGVTRQSVFRRFATNGRRRLARNEVNNHD